MSISFLPCGYFTEQQQGGLCLDRGNKKNVDQLQVKSLQICVGSSALLWGDRMLTQVCSEDQGALI